MTIDEDFLLPQNDGFSMSTEMKSLRVLARCTKCIGRFPPEYDEQGNALTNEQAAHLQWVRCAQCRCGTHDWYRS